MDIFTVITILTVLAAIFGYINVRFLRLPTTIGLMIISILFSLLVIAAGYFDRDIIELETELVQSIDFQKVLMEVMLSF
ncbi:MAG TPA: sodium:proton antiporter, partial [Saprospiraceae bacterium]|nr:sodium:proton antiporter [Saprospiraceae bacterium]